MQTKLKSIYKKKDRYSGWPDVPPINQRCMFSHALQLTEDEFVPQPKLFVRDEIHQGARCNVVGYIEHIPLVRFDGSDREDMVSPEFLIPLELTIFGRELLKASPDLVSLAESLMHKEQT